MSTVHAIFENGVFRPLAHVDLPDQTAVVFEPRPITAESEDEAWINEEIYKILSEEYDSGETDVAARHNEHQP